MKTKMRDINIIVPGVTTATAIAVFYLICSGLQAQFPTPVKVVYSESEPTPY